MYESILVPTDGNELSLQAAEEAIGLADDGGTIHVLSVVEDLPLYRQSGKGAKLKATEDTALRSSLEDATSHIGELAADAGPTSEIEISEGVPYHENIRYAEDNGIDAIVMGKRGTDATAEDFLGSTAERVIRQSMVMVVTVPG